MNMFRMLMADEIECRISQIKKDGSGLSLLLYKDARCDQNILDEVVGPFRWKREHTRDNKNCIVSIWCEELKQWVSKEDTGTESNTEREKGLASDSFKRACFNWGIGRELYTAPFIWIKKGDFTFKDGKCYDRFKVVGIGHKDGAITGLRIKNIALNKIVFDWGKIDEEAPVKPEQPDDEPTVEPVSEAGPSFTRPTVTPAAAPSVTTVAKAPEVTKEEPKLESPQVNDVTQYLLWQMGMLREMREITPKENNKLFKEQHQALIKAKLAPNKKLDQYTMEEAEALIDAMKKCFPLNGTELLVQ